MASMDRRAVFQILAGDLPLVFETVYTRIGFPVSIVVLVYSYSRGGVYVPHGETDPGSLHNAATLVFTVTRVASTVEDQRALISCLNSAVITRLCSIYHIHRPFYFKQNI